MANHLSYDVLSRLIENRAADVEAARAERHLASCPRCRSEREWLERIRKHPHPPHTPPRAWSEREVGPGAWMH